MTYYYPTTYYYQLSIRIQGISMMEIMLPPMYNYSLSLSFVHPCPKPTPELWDQAKNLFLFPAGREPIAVLFRGKKAVVITRMDQEEAKNLVMCKLNLDVSGIKAMEDGFSVANKLGLLNKYPHLRGFLPPKLGDPPKWLYSGLVKTIILQMISYRVARKMLNRFVREFGEPLSLGDRLIYTFPEPEIVYRESVENIKKKATISMSKARAIKEVAKLELEGRLREMEELALDNPHSVAEELMKIKGIGRWTAYVGLMAGVGVWHAQPVDRLIVALKKIGVRCDPTFFSKKPHVAGYISVAILFGEEALRGRYFKLPLRR